MRTLGLLLLFAGVAFHLRAAQLSTALGSGTPPNSAGGSSFSAALSADARHVVFLSHANNLVTNDSMNPWMDLFMRDLANSTTALISVGTNGVGGGNDDSTTPSVSTNARWVAFASAARNLASGDTNVLGDVFLRDMASGITRMISASTNGMAGNGISGNPILSEDGRYVVYESQASDLVAVDTNYTQDVFIYDSVQQTTRLLSTASIYPEVNFNNNGPSHSPNMTPDGHLVAYVKSETNRFLSSPMNIFNGEIFVWDSQTSATHWTSLGVTNGFNGGAGCPCYSPVLSADGQSVIFKSIKGIPSALYRRSVPPQADVPADIIGVNATTQGVARVSTDGRFVAYEATDGIRVWDGVTKSNRLVMANTTGTFTRSCSQPVISPDGNQTVFIVASNGFTTLYRHDYLSIATAVAAVKSNGTPIVVGDSAAPLVSLDGGLIVFDSADDTLVSGDGNRAYDVFAYAPSNGQVELVSARASERPSATPSVASFRWPSSVSANGRYTAVSATDWTPVDTNRFQDLYVRDLRTGAQAFLDGSTNHTCQPAFSADGRYVAYLSVRLPPYALGSGQSPANLFRRDLVTAETMLIHSNAVWDPAASTVAISPDGNRVAFVDRNSLPFGNGNPNLYMRDVPTGTISLISTQGLPPFSSQNYAGIGASTEPRFSPDGRWLFFASTASNLATNHIYSIAPNNLFARDLLNYSTLKVSSIRAPSSVGSYSVSANSRFVATVDSYASSSEPQVSRFDLQTHALIRVPGSVYSRSTSISADGRWIAFDVRPTSGQYFGIYVRDTLSQITEFLSVPLGNTNISTGNSSHPQISHDGRYVIFASDATNLVAGDGNNSKDIFIRDRLRGVTLLGSINRAGTGSGNGNSLLPVLAADGRTLLFQSFASDLIADDFNETADVFVLRLGGADSDGDGMDDDWEAAYFSTLARDGSGDFDGDGSSDAAEHQLGTDPTNAGSVFQVLKLTRDGGPTTKLLWTSMPGRTYRVQFKDDLLASAWSEASQTVTAAGTTAVWTEQGQSAPDNRFYRVLLVP